MAFHRDAQASEWDHSSHQQFYDYFADASQSPETLRRFQSIRDAVLRLAVKAGLPDVLDVVDIGCGAGTNCILWAKRGHLVHGLDINGPLLQLARARAARAGHAIDFRLGSAQRLPWPDASMDVVILLELLEHVPDWAACLAECTRVLRPGGVLYLTTTNNLCPVQQEFNLPLYSWYPAAIKRYFEHLARTSWPDLVNFAKYPAANWFTFYSLRRSLASRGFRCLDRFDMIDLSGKRWCARAVVRMIRGFQPVRWLAHMATPGVAVAAIKERRSANHIEQ